MIQPGMTPDSSKCPFGPSVRTGDVVRFLTGVSGEARSISAKPI